MLFKVKQLFFNPLHQSIIAVALLLAIFTAYFITESWLFPLMLAVPFALLTLLLDYRVLLYLLLMALPFSTNIRLDGINLTIGLPSEPLIGLLVSIAFVFLFLQDKKSGILSHVFSKILLGYWLALVLSFVFSTMPMVSFKTLLVATSYLMVFYYLIAYYLTHNKDKAALIFYLYAFSLAILVVHTTMKHADYGFSKNYSGAVVAPFFSDHTIYGAILAFMVPIVGVLYFKADELKLSYFQKISFGIFFCLFLLGVYLSHSRATWISLACALAMLFILKLKISFKTLIGIAAVAALIASLNMELLMPVLIKNKYDSKAKRANLEEQIRSVTNIKNDVSNVERVNRWLCAYRMFTEKPITGFGVGTYQFKYIPFQKGSEMTEISITSPKNNFKQGVGGTAHSEYLLALSESGIFSFLMLFLMVFYSIYIGMKLYYGIHNEQRYYALMVMLALLTYFIHGIFNNFLTTDKAAFLVWAGLAVLCVLDLQHKKSIISETKNQYEKN